MGVGGQSRCTAPLGGHTHDDEQLNPLGSCQRGESSLRPSELLWIHVPSFPDLGGCQWLCIAAARGI
jgi:hypothetical protein